MQLIERMGDPDCLGILWDTFHANIEDANFSNCISIMGKKLRYLHIADSNRAFPGCGHFDFDSLFKSLADSDFDGYISFECLNRPSAEHVKNNAGRYLSSIRDLF